MKRVKFRDGTFGIRRRGWLGRYEFYDLKSRNSFWWTPKAMCFDDCRTSDPGILNRAWDRLTDPGEPF